MLPKDKPLLKQTADLSGVSVAYTDMGKGEPILFVHGIPTSSYLWRNVIRPLEGEYRCIAPDLMGLGDTDTPLNHRYDIEAQSDKLIELMDHLGMKTFTIVCHDQGGAVAQWLVVHHQERIERFIITNCVCYDNWPVPIVANFARMFRIKKLADLSYLFKVGPLWGPSPFGMRLGVYDKKALSNEAIAEYMKVSALGPEKFEQFRLFTIAGDCKYSMQAAEKFGQFTKPTYIVWAGNDRWLSVSWARKLYDDIAGAKSLDIIPFAGHFVQEEKPELVAEYIKSFMRK